MYKLVLRRARPPINIASWRLFLYPITLVHFFLGSFWAVECGEFSEV